MPAVTLSYYDPNASRMRADTLADFLRAPLTGDLREVPGIGADTVMKLAKHNVKTTQQLMGVYMQQQSCNAFYRWLQTVGVHAHRNTVVRCIAEKTDVLMGLPGHLPGQAVVMPTITESDLIHAGLEPVLESPCQEQPSKERSKEQSHKKRLKKRAHLAHTTEAQ